MEHPQTAMTPEHVSSFDGSDGAASGLTKIEHRPPPALRARPDEDRDFGVIEALSMTSATAGIEVYVGWTSRPIGVAARRLTTGALNWEVAGPLLRERVMAAIEPLRAAGWQVDGTFSVATRWDMSRGTGGDLYEGCWVRMRR